MKQLRPWGLLLTLTILILTGCGGKGDDKGGVPTPGAVPTPAPAAASGSQGSGGQSSGGGQTASGGQAASGGQTQSGSQTQSSGSSSRANRPAFEKVSIGPLTATEEAVVGPLTYQLGMMEGRSAGMTFPGYDYFLIHITVTNTSTAQFSVNSLNHFHLVEPNGNHQKINIQAGIVYKEKIDGNLDPGATVSGWLGFLVKLDDGDYQLVMTHPDFGDATWEFEAPLM